MNRRLKELWIELTADRRKAIALGVLLVFGAGATINLMLKRDAASARPARASASSRGAGSGKSAQAAQPVHAAQASADAPVVHLPPLVELSRNLFEPSARDFPQPAQPEAVAAVRPKSQPVPDEVSAEEFAHRALLETEERVLVEAGSLRLRSVMLGSSPIAVMEVGSTGKRESAVLRVGQEIAGFVLVEVGRDRVVVEKEGVRVQVDLPLP